MLLALSSGCGYSLGFKPRGDIRSIAIPIFENRSLRRELEFPLTEAVVREVQRRTPLIVTSSERADVTLRGEIESFVQAVLVEGAGDVTVESSATVAVAVTVTDRAGRVLLRYAGSGAGPDVNGPAILDSATFVETRGESIARPTAEVFRDLAERIVMLLEETPGQSGAGRDGRNPGQK